MFGIARRRRQAGSCWLRSARPEATSRAARTSAIERFGARPQASSSAGERPAQPGRRGRRAERAAGAAAPVAAHDPRARSPPRGRTRSAARRRPRRAPRRARGAGAAAATGLRRITGPISGSQAKAAMERAQVVIDAEREAHALDPAAGRVPRRGLGAEAAPRRRRPRRGRPPARSSTQSSPRERPAARDHHSVAPRSREPVGPRGHDVLLDRGGYRSFSRWTSTRNERVPATSTSCRGRASRRGGATRACAAGAAPARAGRSPRPPGSRRWLRPRPPAARPPRAARSGAARRAPGAAAPRPAARGPEGSACSDTCAPTYQRVRSYTRYFFTISPPIASMAGSWPCSSRGSSPSRRPSRGWPRPCRSARRTGPAATPVCW